MTKLIYILFVVLVIVACKEKEIPVDADLHGFEFKELICIDTVTYVNQNIRLKAVADGEELTYNWATSEGGIYGSGAEVIFSICHATTVTCYCTVTDKYNHSTKKEIKLTIKQFGYN